MICHSNYYPFQSLRPIRPALPPMQSSSTQFHGVVNVESKAPLSSAALIARLKPDSRASVIASATDSANLTLTQDIARFCSTSSSSARRATSEILKRYKPKLPLVEQAAQFRAMLRTVCDMHEPSHPGAEYTWSTKPEYKM